MNRTAILVPCYNEAPTIGRVVGDFKSLDPDAVVYVYDNNSTDDTARIAAEAGAIVRHERRQGKGHVIRTMFREVDADYYLMVDGDDTYVAAEALAMRNVLDEGYDMVVGDRLSTAYAESGSRPLHKQGNQMVRALVNRLFDSDLRDIMSGSRCMTRRFVKTIPVTCEGFEIETEMTIHALDKGFSVKEVPISYLPRHPESASKLNTFSDGFRVVRSILRLYRDYRPLPFFGVIAFVLGAAAVGMFIVPFEEYLEFGYVYKVPTLVVSIALGISALLSIVCGVLLETIRVHARSSYEFELLDYERDAERARRDDSCR